jgi:hypothetical protein
MKGEAIPYGMGSSDRENVVYWHCRDQYAGLKKVAASVQ